MNRFVLVVVAVSFIRPALADDLLSKEPTFDKAHVGQQGHPDPESHMLDGHPQNQFFGRHSAPTNYAWQPTGPQALEHGMPMVGPPYGYSSFVHDTSHYTEGIGIMQPYHIPSSERPRRFGNLRRSMNGSRRSSQDASTGRQEKRRSPIFGLFNNIRILSHDISGPSTGTYYSPLNHVPDPRRYRR